MSWNFGFKSSYGKYLTAETFQFKLTNDGTSLKKKQIFSLEEEDGKTYVRTPHGRYLSAPGNDKITADAEQKSPTEAFKVHAMPDGRWAFETCHGSFMGVAVDESGGLKIDCFTPKMTVSSLTPERLWTMELAMHPQVCLFNALRKQYVHLKGDELTTDEDIPWGDDAMITLGITDGTYSFETSDGRFLAANGQLKRAQDASTQFVLELHGDQVAFLNKGQYLTVTRGDGKLVANCPQENGPRKNELFRVEDSHPQLKFTSKSQQKKVSVASGVQVSATQSKSEDTETFQIEIRKNGKWQVRTSKNTLWYIDGAACVMSDGPATSDSPDSEFVFEWDGPACYIKANNGKYVAAKPNGALVANADSRGDTSTYVFELINRPKLVLRSTYGFLATNTSGIVRCNNITPEVFGLHVKAGNCHITGANGRYLAVNAAGIGAEGSAPEDWYFEFTGPSVVSIKVGDKYLQASQNGDVKATGSSIGSSTQFEF